MTESKKGPKQVTINAFFSPTKVGHESDEHATESELTQNNRGTKTSVSAVTNSEVIATKSEKKKPKTLQVTVKANIMPKMKVQDKTKEGVKPRKKNQQSVHLTSRHVVVIDADEDDLGRDDVVDPRDGKRAQEKVESCGENGSAGMSVSDDSIVIEEDTGDGKDENRAMRHTEKTEDIEKDKTLDADLTIATLVEDTTAIVATKIDDRMKTRSRKAMDVSGEMTGMNVASKAIAKQQQKMREKAAATLPNVVILEPLDPVVQARIDMYKMKTDELTRMYSDLLVSNHKSDVVMQDIYGARLDCDLNVTVGEEKVQQALAETWQKLRDQALCTMNAVDTVITPSIVKFPHEVKCLIVKGVQGRSASLSVVCGELLAAFKRGCTTSDVDMEAPEQTVDMDTVDRAACLALEMEIKMLAQRIPHGVRPAKANVFEDTSVDALWVWEVGSLEKYFGDEAQKMVKRMRKHRKRLGHQLKALAKVVQLLHQKPVDEAKVSAEEAKVGKFGLVVATEIQKAKDREAREVERRNVLEEKKRLDLERQEAKSEEKRKRDREVEEKELESYKAQKKFKSFFASAATNNGGSRDDIMDRNGDQNAAKTADVLENKSTKIARMDATISYLSCAKDAPTPGAVAPFCQSIFSSLQHKRRGTRKTDLNNVSSWSCRRYRDSKLGVMKLLQFYENNRPAYFGTFSTRSQLFHGGRRPFARYSKFDYSIDSDDEWEEEEPGESLSDDENDGDESDEDNLDYDDQWLAYEDEVDYMDDTGEEVDSTEHSERQSSPTKHKLPSQLHQKRVKAKAMKPAKLEPQIKLGPFWFDHDENGHNCTEDGQYFSGFLGELFVEPMFESNLMRKAREYDEEEHEIAVSRQEQQAKVIQEQEKLAVQVKSVEKKAGMTAETNKLTSPKSRTEVTPEQSKTLKVCGQAIAAVASPCAVKKMANQIDSWFKKVSDSVSPPSKPLSSEKAAKSESGKNKAKDNTTIEVISVD